MGRAGQGSIDSRKVLVDTRDRVPRVSLNWFAEQPGNDSNEKGMLLPRDMKGASIGKFI